jgi:sugar O-acyltransferase (sialic acid O-acetyltransferase NeuD family)
MLLLWKLLKEMLVEKSMPNDVVIIGAGGHGKVVADIIIKSGDSVIGFLDDGLEKGTLVLGFPVLGSIHEIDWFKQYSFIIAIGNNHTRKKIAENFTEFNYYTAIHPAAVIGLDVEVGIGTVVMANAVVNPSSVIGNHCIINTGAVIEHDNQLKDYVHLSPNSATGGTVQIGELTHIGLGASIRNNITITSGCLIGAGSLIVKDISVKGTYYGTPAQKVN